MLGDCERAQASSFRAQAEALGGRSPGQPALPQLRVHWGGRRRHVVAPPTV